MCDFYVITLFLRVNRIETSQLIAKIKTLRTKCAINPLQLIGRGRERGLMLRTHIVVKTSVFQT